MPAPRSRGCYLPDVTGGWERWVHLYEFRVGDLPGPGDRELLRDEELARASHIADPVRRARFVARRAALREILSGYAGQRPHDVDLRSSGVCFSCSHSQDVAVVAVARRPVGVDVEVEKHRRAPERIAARMFCAEERAVLDAVDGDVRRHLFHRCWVAKEAYAKGLGRGLGMRFDGFSVAAALCSWDEAGRVDDPLVEGEEWSVAVATMGDTHTAVAAMGSDWTVQRRPLHRPAAEVPVA